MEAKVDIRKLQLLNDRIAQVLDALNQVRLSVHGLTHAGAPFGQSIGGLPLGIYQPQLGFQQPQLGFQQQIPYTAGQPMGFQQTPYFAGAPGSVPFGQLPFQSGLQSPLGGGFGLQHTGGYNPYASLAQSLQGITPVPGWSGSGPAWPSLFGGGLYHSPELMEQRLIEQKATDPNRILQTFPFCLAPVSTLTTW